MFPEDTLRCGTIDSPEPVTAPPAGTAAANGPDMPECDLDGGSFYYQGAGMDVPACMPVCATHKYSVEGPNTGLSATKISC